MTENEEPQEDVSEEELEQQEAEPLPDREVMSVLHGPTGPPAIAPEDALPPAG